MHREDFPILESGLIYFDNGATTLKPKCVVDAIVDYYTNYTANAHRGDYDNSFKVDQKYENVRSLVQQFIHADRPSEIVFTSGATDSLNRVVFGFMKYQLHAGDEVLITKAEHASNVLPWMELEKEIGIIVKYIPLLSDNTVSIENVQKVITDRTKVISIAHVSNVVGDERPVEEIGEICQQKEIYFVVDGSQSVPHMPIDVQQCHIDFLAFSGHKMLGPTGIGVLYGRFSLLDQLKPTIVGGGMNADFESDGSFQYKSLPSRLEAGTPNIAGVIGLGEAIRYLKKIGMEQVQSHERNLKRYLVEQLEQIPNVVIYNPQVEGAIIAFNLKDVFSQDTASYLNHYHICVRAGNHCAKILKDELHVKNTCRISFYLYNTKEEIDQLVKVLKRSDEIFQIII